MLLNNILDSIEELECMQQTKRLPCVNKALLESASESDSDCNRNRGGRDKNKLMKKSSLNLVINTILATNLLLTSLAFN